MKRIYRRGLAVWLVALLFIPVLGMPSGAKEAKDLNDGSYGGLMEYSAIEGYGSELTEANSPAGWTPEDPYWVDLVDAQGLDYKGEDVYVAVLDTGMRYAWKTVIDQNRVATDLARRFTYNILWDDVNKEFYNSDLIEDNNYITKDIGNGHGTHVTSTIVGFDLAGPNRFLRGVAPSVTIIPVLVVDTWLLSCPDDYVAPSDWWPSLGPYGPSGAKKVRFAGCNDVMVSAGIDYITGLAKNQLKGKKIIISMSLSFGQVEPGIEASIDKAIDAGIVVVASAGNEGLSGMGWPAAYGNVISCGAAGWGNFYLGSPPWFRRDIPEDLKTEDYWENEWQIYIPAFSSRPNKDKGQKSSDLDLCAPGVGILGPYQVQVYWSGTAWVKASSSMSWNWLQGTSMAAPHVAAIAAIVLEWAADDDGGDGVDITQKHMEHILQNAAVKDWPPGDYKGATIYNAFTGAMEDVTWDRNDWGKGLLQADDALTAAEDYVDENF